MTDAKMVLIVDDDPGMNHALQRLLNAAGYKAVAFSSAEDLLETGPEIGAGCLILDVHLPGMSGFALFRKLKEKGGPPAVFITAYDDLDSQSEAESLGAAGYFTKPFPGHALLAAIARATGSPPSRRGLI